MSDLTTAAAVQAYLQIPVTQDAALLASLVTAVSDWVLNYLSRDMTLQNYTETQDGSGTDVMILRQGPVTAVTSVTVYGVAVLPSVLQSVGYLFDREALYYIGYWWPKDRQNVTITYSAGYEVIPPSLAQAVNEMIALKYRRVQVLGKDAENIAGEGTHYTLTDVPGYVLPVLDVWRRTFAV